MSRFMNCLCEAWRRGLSLLGGKLMSLIFLNATEMRTFPSSNYSVWLLCESFKYVNSAYWKEPRTMELASTVSNLQNIRRVWSSIKCNDGSFHKSLLVCLSISKNTTSSIWNVCDIRNGTVMIFILLSENSWIMSGLKWTEQLFIRRIIRALGVSFAYQ
jgi:hypothetical protein